MVTNSDLGRVVLKGTVIQLVAPYQAVGEHHDLPTVAPTFDWVRLAQRIPVRIRFTALS